MKTPYADNMIFLVTLNSNKLLFCIDFTWQILLAEYLMQFAESELSLVIVKVRHTLILQNFMIMY